MGAEWVSSDKRAHAEVDRDGWTDDRESGGHETLHLLPLPLARLRRRPRFTYTLSFDGETVAHGSDLAGPAFGPEPSEDAMLATLASFVSAWAESLAFEARHPGRGSEHGDLFPREAAPWADYADEFAADTDPGSY